MKKQKQKIDNNLPIIDEDNYNISLANALNYFNNEYSTSDYKNAVIDYASTIGIDIPRGIPEIEFRSIGGGCALLLNGQNLSLKHYQQIIERINTLSKMSRDKKEEVIEEIKPKPVEDDTIDFILWLEDSIDDIILGKTKELINITNKYASYAFNKQSARKVVKVLETKLKLYEKDFNDFTLQDVQDAYPKITKTGIKKLITSLEEFKQSISKIDVSIKPKKEKPASVQTAKMPYLKEYNNIKGLHPKDVIGKSVVYIFDTTTRDLICLYSIAGKFKASGATYLNLDESKCVKKKLRNEVEILNQLQSLLEVNKKSYKEVFDSIKTKEQKASGRLSSERIILKAF